MLAIAGPMIFSNVTTPLIGAVDTAVIGQLGAAHLIGAVAVGATIFTFFYWAFGFLRMGTTGLTAQASGAERNREVLATLYRALLVAGTAGVAIIMLQWPIAEAAFALMGASPDVDEAARTYFAIRIWSAPAALANYALVGWFIGLGRAGMAFRLQLLLNLTNIALDALFVLAFGWGVAGVAAGTLIAETGAALVGLAVALRASAGLQIRLWRVFNAAKLRRMIAVNGDIMIRTLSLLFAFSFFTAQGARAGDLILAANAILMHFLSVSAYFLDGIAYATEALTGKAIGARNLARFHDAVRLSSIWAAGLSLAVGAVFWLGGDTVIDAMTVNEAVRSLARDYLVWAALAPVIGVACFQLDGIFIGATRTRDMRNMMLVSLAVYLLAWAALTPPFGNHGLWAALMVLFITRALTLAIRLPALKRDAFARVLAGAATPQA
ncbi:MATE family multidrug resistance protein [Dichotomicrobium thermohalophilum]|uniref:MATE family multidrug resistance protein n=1 Tax=Dichotomicrobium thermohalophilum TaxID=933063 RepID=A0A397PJQ9_9HYPH|nr:MATE family multidrug resistance protein [Dichotomicrobium thermohalophilum]